MYLPNGSRPQAGFGVRIGERIAWHAFSIGIVGLILAALLGALHVLDRVAPEDPEAPAQRAESPISDSPMGTRPFGAAWSPRSATRSLSSASHSRLSAPHSPLSASHSPLSASHSGVTLHVARIPTADLREMATPMAVSAPAPAAARDDVRESVDVASPPTASASR